jgi:hypothetical protein
VGATPEDVTVCAATGVGSVVNSTGSGTTAGAGAATGAGTADTAPTSTSIAAQK